MAMKAKRLEEALDQYAGNIPGQVGRWENTYCPQCQQLLIVRTGFWIDAYHLTPGGHCPHCGTATPGIWWPKEEARHQRASVFAHRIARVL
jgi:hypothetical protein